MADWQFTTNADTQPGARVRAKASTDLLIETVHGSGKKRGLFWWLSGYLVRWLFGGYRGIFWWFWLSLGDMAIA